MATKKNVREILWLNIINLLFLIGVIYVYYHRKNIIQHEQPISGYTVTEIHCGKGRNHSTITVNFNNDTYHVGISRQQCKSFDPKNITLYHDKTWNLIFEKDNTSFRMVVAAALLYVFWCVWLIVVVWKYQYSKESALQQLLKRAKKWTTRQR